MRPAFGDEKKPVAIPGALCRETEKAYLWTTDDGDDIWVPKSQVVEEKEDELLVTRWFMERLSEERGA